MSLLKKCLIEFNNQFTNKITEKEVDDDELLRFTLLDMQKFAKKYVEAINVTHCCETVKEKCTHTFEVDLNNEQVQKQRCKYIEQIHALPTRLFMYNPKTDEYIELKP